MHTLLQIAILNCAHKWFLKVIKTEWQVSSNEIKPGSSNCICACMDKNPSAPPSGHAGGMQSSLGNADCAALTGAQTAGCPSSPQLHSTQHRLPVKAAGETGQSAFKPTGKQNSFEPHSRYPCLTNTFNQTTLIQDLYRLSGESIKYMKFAKLYSSFKASN